LRTNKIAWLFFIAPALLMLSACSTNRAPATEARSAGPKATIFGDELTLTGYSIGNKGGHTEVELRWKSVRKPGADYFVFVHALDRSGEIAFQADHALKNATGAPTSAWTADEQVTDRFFVIPTGKPPGAYNVRIGVYIPSPMKVLQLTQVGLPQPTDDWKRQAVLIENVTCQ